MYYTGELPPWYDYGSYIYYVSLPEGLTSIRKHAFFGCKMVSITIPRSISHIDGDAFGNFLASVTIHSNEIVSTTDYTKRMSGYFGSNVKQYIIGESVQKIGEYAFIDSSIESVILSEGLIHIGHHAFSGCSKLTSINIPNSTKRIDTYAFWKCTGLSAIYLPDNITEIEEFAFLSCSNIKTVSVGRNVTNITKVFKFCSEITKFIVHAPIPPEGGVTNDLFQDKCTLYVHRDNISVYENSVWWEDFFAIKAIEEDTSVGMIETTSSLTYKRISNGQVLIKCGDKTYTIQGQEVK